MNGVYNFTDKSAWYLIHDGDKVIAKGQGGQATSKVNEIIDFDNEVEMEAAIINMGLEDTG